MVTLVGKNKVNNQRGFSLVELMVVVAIIGVLAAIAVPNVSKYIAKARQSEAKTNLSSLYTSEKAFYAEYTAYHSYFQAVGYSPEGQLRYNVGFSARTAANEAGTGNGYTMPPGINTATNTNAYCAAPAATTLTNGCKMLNGATNAAPPSLPAATINSATTFTAAAVAVIHSVGTTDTWTIDQNKLMTNTVLGIP